jgi:hypothetical protein
LWLIWLIFMILGFVKSFMGQREHGRMQERNMLHALICFIMAVILPFMGSLVITVASFGAFLNSSGNDSAGTITWMILGSGLFSVAAAVLTALTYTKIIGAYAQGDGGNLKIAATFMVLNPVISLVVVALLLPGGISAGTVSSNLSGALSVGGIVGLLAVLLFYTVFRRVIARMDSGELGPGVVVPEETPGQVTVRERYRTPGGPRWPPMR